MANLTLYCIVEGRSTSHAFPVKIAPTTTSDHLVEIIKAEQAPAFDDITPDQLRLWLVKIPEDKEDSPVTVDALDKKTELKHPRGCFSELLPDGPDNNTYIVVQRTLPALKRVREQYLEDPRKLPKIDDWVKYDAKDGSVDLPPVLISMLDNGDFTPAPRDEFKQQLDNVEFGQQITLPSIGQIPRHYGEGYQGMAFLVTEQMVSMWELLSKDGPRAIVRVLSGPMGIGKSYLALFLAAKAYAEGWPLLYVADAGELAVDSTVEISRNICKRFLALNKDILTVAHFQEMTFGYPSGNEVITRAASSIINNLLQQKDTKTLLVVDEHGALFGQDPPIPVKHAILNPLMQIGVWSGRNKGARVILAGTVHAKFERQYVKGDMWNWQEYVTPLSDYIFDKLLDMDDRLSRETIGEHARDITNRVPRELVNMVAFLHQSITDTDNDEVVMSQMDKFNGQRFKVLYHDANSYFSSLDDVHRRFYRKALETILFDRSYNIHIEKIGFDHEFMDLGLVYQIKVGACVEYRPLCEASKDALQRLYYNDPSI
ncbi:hypothetical protein BGZ58_009014 [Dissophora ornata]|nr:hypothetical protein BGZ58_009014 [Dissophora ornata]